jgi:hypothetical protein
MSEPCDLFPETAPSADPVMGKAVQTNKGCLCGTSIAVICAGRGPHAAELRCQNCDRHVQWLSHADHQAVARFLDEFGNQFGAPTEIIYRLSPTNKTESEMANGEYDNTNHGALFRNNDKSEDRHADYRGTINVAGTEYWLNAWLKTSKKGVKFMSLSVKPKEDSKEKSKPDFDDQIPF